MSNSEFNKSFSEIFTELLEKRGTSLTKLSALTNIPKRYLTAFQEGDFKNLPAAPYIRGYLSKIAAALEADTESLWQAYKREGEIKTSGERDILPSNRFAIRSFNKGWFIFLIAIILIGGYLVTHIDDVRGTPTIEVSIPESTLVVDEDSITVSGRVSPGDELALNGGKVLVGDDGSFEKEVLLESGLNTLEFRAKRFLGRETRLLRQIFYQPSFNNGEEGSF